MEYDDVIEALQNFDRAHLRRIAFEALMLADGPDSRRSKHMSNTQAGKLAAVGVKAAPTSTGMVNFRVYGKVHPNVEKLFTPRRRNDEEPK